MSSHVLAKLKSLQFERGDASPFETHTAFLAWADSVTPLLAFDKAIQTSFKNTVATAESLNAMNGIEYPVRAVNHAIGILNQGATALELQEAIRAKELASPPLLQPSLEAPPKVTVKWLYEHVPFPLVAGAVALLASAFAVGIAFSETQMYALIKATIATPSTSNPSAAAKSTVNAPTTVPHIASAPK